MASTSSGLRRGHMWSVELVGLMMSFHMLSLSPLTAMEKLLLPGGRKRFSRSWWTWLTAERIRDRRRRIGCGGAMTLCVRVTGGGPPAQSHPRHVHMR
jgi:hypothetical protein